MALKWRGKQLTAKIQRAEMKAIDSTMGAAILNAKANHGAGARNKDGTPRFTTRTGEAERSIRIVDKAKRDGRGAVGRWGSKGINYFLRLELGFQGKDSRGRVFDQQERPSLIPARDAEYPKLTGRIRRALRTGRA